jgi:hypothetical protein
MDDQTTPPNAAPEPEKQPDQGGAPATPAPATSPAPAKVPRWRQAASALVRGRKRKGGAVMLTPATTEQSPEAIAERIEQIALESGTPLSAIVAMLSSQSNEVKTVIAGFDEDKEHVVGRGVSHLVTVLCYVLPWLVAFYAGYALGFKYSGGQSFSPALNQVQNAYYYIVSWGYEFALCGLMVAVVRQFKRIRSAGVKQASPMLIMLIVTFLVLAITSACAQWILFEHNIDTKDASQIIGAVFRTAGGPLIDAAGAIVLAVLYSITLDQQLNTMQKKNTATIAMNRQNVKAQLEVLEAAMQVKGTLQKEEDYQRKQELANTLIGLFSEQAIEAVKDQLQGRRTVNGSAYRRDTYR